jgi:hypothetical protein
MKLFSMLALVLLTMASSVRAANEGGHGGMGIYLNGQLYLVDLVEVGVEGHPMFDTTIQPRKDYVDRLTAVLQGVFPGSSQEITLIAGKLTEISKYWSNQLSEALVQGIEGYSWYPVNRQLINPGDDHTSLKHKPNEIVPLAIRKNNSIMLSKQDIALLPVAHRAALILHEVVFSFVKPVNGDQDSTRVKEFIGYIFSHQLSKLTQSTGVDFSGISLPNYNMTIVERINWGLIDFDAYLFLGISGSPVEKGGGSGLEYDPNSGFRPVSKRRPPNTLQEFCAHIGDPTVDELVVTEWISRLEIKRLNYIGLDSKSHDYLQSSTGWYTITLERKEKYDYRHLNDKRMPAIFSDFPTTQAQCEDWFNQKITEEKNRYLKYFTPY